MRLCTHLCERLEQVGRDQRLNVRVAVDGAIGAQVGAEERQQPRGLDVGRLRADLRKGEEAKRGRGDEKTNTRREICKRKTIKSNTHGEDSHKPECMRES